jgi:hypothetical protein
MPPTMGKKKVKKHKQPRESFHLPDNLREALRGFADEADPPTDKSSVLRRALEEYLSKKGRWPPPGNRQ